MANVKITSYVDAVNGMARAAMLTDLQKALAPIIETMTSIHGVCLALKQKQDDLTERVEQLEQGRGETPLNG